MSKIVWERRPCELCGYIRRVKVRYSEHRIAICNRTCQACDAEYRVKHYTYLARKNQAQAKVLRAKQLKGQK